METIELAVEVRDRVGKGAARQARRQGRLPGVLYGPKRTTISVTVNADEFAKKVDVGEGSHLIKLISSVADISGRLALVKIMQRDPVSRTVLHTDFYEVDMDTKLTVPVPLHYVGHPAGVEEGGIMQPIQREINVLCLPTDIPEFIEVDVSHLGIHEAVHVSELKLPPGVEVSFDTDFALVTVLPPTVEEVATKPAEGEAVAAAEGEAAAAPAAGKGAGKAEGEGEKK